MVLFQKRMVSSIEAIRRSLERRLAALVKLRDGGEAPRELSPEESRRLDDYLSDPDSLSDEEREKLEAWLESLPIYTRVDLEVAKLAKLCAMAREIQVETKAEASCSSWRTCSAGARRRSGCSPSTGTPFTTWSG